MTECDEEREREEQDVDEQHGDIDGFPLGDHFNQAAMRNTGSWRL